MTNTQIIATECIVHGIYTAEQLANMAEIPVHTYQYWKSIGYQVRKGEKAAIKTKLWKMVNTVEPEAEPEEEKAPALRLVPAYLFTLQQVDKIESAQKKTSSAESKKSAQKKTSSARKTLTDAEAKENLNKIKDTPVKLVTKSDIEKLCKDNDVDKEEIQDLKSTEQIHGLDLIQFDWNHGSVKGTWKFHMGGMFPMGQKDFKVILSDMLTAPNSSEVIETVRRFLHNEKIYYSENYNKGRMKMLDGNLKQLCAIA